MGRVGYQLISLSLSLLTNHENAIKTMINTFNKHETLITLIYNPHLIYKIALLTCAILKMKKKNEPAR